MLSTKRVKVFESEYFVVEEPDYISKGSNLYSRIWPSMFVMNQLLATLHQQQSRQHDSTSSRQRICEVGCGLGILSCQAAKLFNTSTATTATSNSRTRTRTMVFGFDFVEDAVEISRANARSQGLDEDVVEFFRHNWHNEYQGSHLQELGQFDLVFASDCLYMSNSIYPLSRLVDSILLPSGLFLLVDPGRGYEEAFLDELTNRGLSSKLIVLTTDHPFMQTIPDMTLMKANIILAWRKGGMIDAIVTELIARVSRVHNEVTVDHI